MSDSTKQPIALAITGASGSPYALRLLDCLIDTGQRVYLMISQAGQLVLNMEAGLDIPSRAADAERFLCERLDAAEGQLRVFGRQQWTAPVASGSNPPKALTRTRAYVLPTTAPAGISKFSVCRKLLTKKLSRI